MDLKQIERTLFGDDTEQVNKGIGYQPPQQPQLKIITSEEVDSITDEASSLHGVPKQLIRAIIDNESDRTPDGKYIASGKSRVAGHPSSATGLMQLIDSTAKSMGVEDATDPKQNVMGGAKYLRSLMDRYNGDQEKALAAYFKGPKTVDEWLKQNPDVKQLPGDTGGTTVADYIGRVSKNIQKYGGKLEVSSTSQLAPDDINNPDYLSKILFGEIEPQQTKQVQPAQPPIGQTQRSEPFSAPLAQPQTQRSEPFSMPGGIQEQEKEGIIPRLAKAWGRSVASLESGVGGALELTHIPGVKNIGQAVSEDAKAMREFYKVEDAGLVDQIAEGVSSGLQFLVPGLGVAKGAKVVSMLGNTANAAKIASWLGIGTNAVLEAAVESGNSYNALQEKGVDDKEATTRALGSFGANLALITATNVVGGMFGRNIDEVKKTIPQLIKEGAKKLPKEMLSEGFQESGQEVIGDVAEKEKLDAKNILMAGGIGALTAGIMSPVGLISENQQRKPSETETPSTIAEKTQPQKFEIVDEKGNVIPGAGRNEPPPIADDNPLIGAGRIQEPVVSPTEIADVPSVQTVPEEQPVDAVPPATTPEVKSEVLPTEPATPKEITATEEQLKSVKEKVSGIEGIEFQGSNPGIEGKNKKTGESRFVPPTFEFKDKVSGGNFTLKEEDVTPERINIIVEGLRKNVKPEIEQKNPAVEPVEVKPTEPVSTKQETTEKPVEIKAESKPVKFSDWHKEQEEKYGLTKNTEVTYNVAGVEKTGKFTGFTKSKTGDAKARISIKTDTGYAIASVSPSTIKGIKTAEPVLEQKPEEIKKEILSYDRPPEVQKEVEQVNVIPTDAQKEAGNYKKGHIKLSGMDVSIENAAGSERRGTSPEGKQWVSKMNHDYGYIRGTKGADAYRGNNSDQLDVFMKPGITQDESGDVFVVNQKDPKTGKFDEHKVMVGFTNKTEASKAYLSNYEKGWKGLKSVVRMPMEEFKKWAYSDQTQFELKEKESEQDIISKMAEPIFIREKYGDEIVRTPVKEYTPYTIKNSKHDFVLVKKKDTYGEWISLVHKKTGLVVTTQKDEVSLKKQINDAIKQRGIEWFDKSSVDSNIERLKGKEIEATPEMADLYFKEGFHPRSYIRLEEGIKNKDADILESVLHLKNKKSRELFTKKTGVELPKTMLGTVSAIRDFIGKEVYDKGKAVAKEEAIIKEEEAKTKKYNIERDKLLDAKVPGQPGSTYRTLIDNHAKAGYSVKVDKVGIREVYKLVKAGEPVSTILPKKMIGEYALEKMPKYVELAKSDWDILNDELSKINKEISKEKQFNKKVELNKKRNEILDKIKKLNTEKEVPIEKEDSKKTETLLKSEPIKTESTPVSIPESKKTPLSNLVDNYVERLKTGEKIKNTREILDFADKVHGGTIGEGKYGIRDAYDALETAMNKHIEEKGLSENPKEAIASLNEVIKILPTQTVRTEDQVEKQQFSTPPSEAYLAVKASGIKEGMSGLEPSAGDGNIATMMRIANKGKGTIHVNEIDARRRENLKILGFDPTNHDAEYLHSTLPENVKPDVVVMNPPFSSTGGRLKSHDTGFGAEHVRQALLRLKEGGRLVAIVGNGMAFGKPKMAAWWNRIKKEYNVRANIGISGKEYEKYGTGFDNNIIVIDKTGPTENIESAITGEGLTVEQGYDKLEPLMKEDVYGRIKGNVSEPGKTVDEEKSKGSIRGETANITGTPAVSGSGRGTDTKQGSRAKPKPVEDMGEPVGVGSESTGTVDTEGVQPGTDAGPVAETKQGPAKTVLPEPGSGDVGRPERKQERVQLKKEVKSSIEEESGGVYAKYKVKKAVYKGAVPHPANISESVTMASIEVPDVTYELAIPKNLITSGAISDAQLEAITYACQAHEQRLPNGMRKEYLIGDGTGMGKARTLLGIIYENSLRGKKKFVYITKSKGLVNQLKGDMEAMGINIPVIPLEKYKKGDKIDASEGILFGTYSTVSGDFSSSKGRYNQVLDWFGKDTDSVFVFDESHLMKNVSESYVPWGSNDDAVKQLSEGSQRGQMGVQFKKDLPNARFVNASATAATEPVNLAYLTRLGLWGEGTPFKNFIAFLNTMRDGGVGAMELLARDMKANGLYLARSISYDGVNYDTLNHVLTKDEKMIYNDMADFWSEILVKMEEAAKNANMKKESQRIMKQFYAAQQRFFLQLMMSFQVETMIKDADTKLKNGNSIVISLFNTNEQQTDKKVSEAINNGIDIDSMDFSPKDSMKQMIENNFPIYQYEEYNDEDGAKRVRQVIDPNTGEPLINKENLDMRQKLIDKIENFRTPENPIDRIVNHFGFEKVAEITGRKKRIVVVNGRKEYRDRAIKGVAQKDINTHELKQFMNGDKRVAIISGAAATGFDLHASLKKKNQQRRVFYALQLSWSADEQMQSFGRVHRTMQASAPEIVLVKTDIASQQRLINTIQSRLASLGAISKGERESLSGGIFSIEDITDSYGTAALGQTIRDLDQADLIRMNAYDKEGNIKSAISQDVSGFLNRIMVLPIDKQNEAFAKFYSKYRDNVEHAKQTGTFDTGVEKIAGENIRTSGKPVVLNSDKSSGIKTELVTVEYEKKTNKELIQDRREMTADLFETKNKVSQRGYLYRFWKMDDKVSVYGPRGSHATISRADFMQKYEKATKEEVEKSWKEEYDKIPDFETVTTHLVTGSIFPVYNKIFFDAKQGRKIKRATLNDGRSLIGVEVSSTYIPKIKQNFGIGSNIYSASPQELVDLIKSGSIVELDNGWKISERRVMGEDRIELDPGRSYVTAQQMEGFGLFNEIIAFSKRYFIPTDNEKSVSAMGNILKQAKPVRDLAAKTEDYSLPLEITTKKDIPTPILTNSELSEIAQRSDNMGYNLTLEDKKEILGPIIQKLKNKGVTFVDAYHITNGNINSIKKEGLKGTKLDYIGGTGGNLRDSSVYLFLDPDDIKKGKDLLTSSKNDAQIVHIKIPISELIRLNWDSNFNLSAGTYTAERFLGDIQKEWIDDFYNVTTEDASAPIEMEPEKADYSAPLSPEPAPMPVKSIIETTKNAPHGKKVEYAVASNKIGKQMVAKKTGRGLSFLDAKNKFYQKFVDLTWPISQIEDQWADDIGADRKKIRTIDIAISKVRGAGGIAKQFIEDNMTNILDSIPWKIRSKVYTELNKYLIAKRTVWLYENKDSYIDAGISVEDAQSLVEFVETGAHSYSEEINRIAPRMWDFNKKLLQVKKDHGVIDDELLSSLAEPYYVPFYRDIDENTKLNIPKGEKYTNIGKGIKRIQGSTSGAGIIEPLQNMMQNSYETFVNAYRADVMNKIIDFAESSPELGKMFEKVPPKWVKVGTIEYRGEVDMILRPKLKEFANKLGITVEEKPKVAGFVGGKMKKILGKSAGNKIELMIGATESQFSHELGHQLHKKYSKWVDPFIDGFVDELNEVADTRYLGLSVPASYVSYCRNRNEKFAEFVSMYITDRENLQTLAPNAFMEFETRIALDNNLRELIGFKPSNVSGMMTKEKDNWVQDWHVPQDREVVSVLREGKIVSYRCPVEVADAIKNMHPAMFPTWFRIFTLPMSILRKGAVTFNIGFITPNSVRDNQESAFNAGTIPVYDFLIGLKEYLTNGDMYKQYYRLGGGMDSVESGTRRFEKSVDDLKYGSKYGKFLDQMYWNQAGVLKGTLETGWAVLTSPFDLISKMGEASEMASRIGTYRRAMVGMPDWLKWYNNEVHNADEAIHIARQATVDFQRFGSYGRTANELIPFINAAIQGYDKMIRTVKDDPRRALLAAFLYVFGPMMAFWLWNKDKEGYKAVPLQDKINNFIIMNPDEKSWIKIPKGHIVKFIGNPVQVTMEKIYGTVLKSDASIIKQVLSDVSPIDISSIPVSLRLIIEPIANYDLYWNREIEKPYHKAILAAGERYDKKTAEAIKIVGKALNISPIMMQHEIEIVGAGTAKNILWLADIAMGKIDATRFGLEKMPVTRSFYGKIGEWGTDIDSAIIMVNKELAKTRSFSIKKMVGYSGYTPEEIRKVSKANVEKIKLLYEKRSQLMKASEAIKHLRTTEE